MLVPDLAKLTLQLAGASLLGLALFHAVLWRSLGWGREIAALSPLSARVFAAHTFFIAFVLAALGALSLARAELLLAPSELARLLLGAATLFWCARLAMQPVVFDPVMTEGWPSRPWVRVLATAAWAAYAAIYGLAFAHQLARGAP